MSQHAGLSARFLMISLVLAGLSACARGPEFQGVPQQGVSNTGTFPTFARTPRGETKQLTTQETASVTSTLDADKRRVQGVTTPPAATQAQLDAERRKARQAADETLKEIEATGSN